MDCSRVIGASEGARFAELEISEPRFAILSGIADPGAEFGTVVDTTKLAPQLDTPVLSRIEEVRESFPFVERQRAVFEAGVAKLQLGAIEALFTKYAEPMSNTKPNAEFKYLDIGYWLWSKAKWVVLLGLDRAQGLRILDLGCGPSHFGFLCEALGHKVVGLDVDVPIYIDLCKAFAVERRTFRIERDAYLPILEGPFDLVTAFDVCFNYIGGLHYYWSLADWIGLFGEVVEVLRPRGNLLLYLNTMRTATGEYQHDERLVVTLIEGGAERIENRRNRLLISRENLRSEVCTLPLPKRSSQ
jgi:SAM-dependent methyltransferase